MVHGVAAIDLTMSNVDILINSDVFVGRFLENDLHSERIHSLSKIIEKDALTIATTNLIVAESATVLSNRVGQRVALKFLEFVSNIKTHFVDQNLFSKSLELFTRQNRRGTSFVDCSNVVVMREFDIPQIFSFDRTYSKDHRLRIFGE